MICIDTSRLDQLFYSGACPLRMFPLGPSCMEVQAILLKTEEEATPYGENGPSNGSY